MIHRDKNNIDPLKFLFSGITHLKEVIFPMGISIDVTKRCNLNCKHCYFQHQNYKEELDKEEWLEMIKKIKKAMPNIRGADWVGGEPLLRPDLIEEGMKYFANNTVITNGTIEFPKWENCLFIVSIDGTEKYYEKIRGKNIYQQVKKNTNRADLNIYINFTINKKNAICIKDFLEEWYPLNARGVLFTFYTPIKGIAEDLSISWQERDAILDELIALKGQYGGFIMNSVQILKLMKFKKAKEVIEKCIFRERAFLPLDSGGKPKNPCPMGKGADCSKCGCIVPFYVLYLKDKKIRLAPNYKEIFP